MKRALRILLTVCFIFITLSGCGQKTGDLDELTGHEALLTLPAKTDIEKLADLNGSAAVQAYLTARTYLDDFLDYNIENGNYEEYRVLLEKTIVAFEEVDIHCPSIIFSIEVSAVETIPVSAMTLAPETACPNT